MIPIAGSAYTYAYATLGEIIAWIIGWDLILEYAVSNMAVAVGFSAYFNDILDNIFGWHLPAKISGPIFASGEADGRLVQRTGAGHSAHPDIYSGARRSRKRQHQQCHGAGQDRRHPDLRDRRGARGEEWRTGIRSCRTDFPGVLTGAAIVFFTYIGFDSVSTAAEECHRPQRDLPLGIISTLVICAVLYIAVSLVLTGIAHYTTLNNAAPVANALKALGFNTHSRLGERRRNRGNALVAAGISVWAGAHLVCDVARRAAAEGVFEGSPASIGRRISAPGSRGWWWAFRRASGHRHFRRPGEYRDAVRVHRSVGGRDRAAPPAAGPAARLPRAGIAVPAGAVDCYLPGADDVAAARDVGAVRGVADRWIRDLLPVRAQAQRAAKRSGGKSLTPRPDRQGVDALRQKGSHSLHHGTVRVIVFNRPNVGSPQSSGNLGVHIHSSSASQ